MGETIKIVRIYLVGHTAAGRLWYPLLQGLSGSFLFIIKNIKTFWRGIAQSIERPTSDRRVGSSTLLAVQVPKIQNRSISGSKIGCAPVPE